MYTTAMIFLLAATPAAAPRAEHAPGPISVARIDHTYPPPRDARHPDRTIADVDAQVLGYSPDGRSVITGDSHGAVKIWQARTGEEGTGELLRTLDGQKGRILALGWKGEDVLV